MSSDITLAITGASGTNYALRLLEHLIKAGKTVHLMVSKPGQIVLGMESELHLSAQPVKLQQQLSAHFNASENQLRVYGKDQWTAPIASGSGVSDIMIVCPCTTGTLAAIANGHSRDLLERAADVTIKEHKKLILVVRETPLSAIHLEHMLKLAQLGIIIMPASPGFYHGASSIDDIVDFMVSRILDHIGIDNDLVPRWGQSED